MHAMGFLLILISIFKKIEWIWPMLYYVIFKYVQLIMLQSDS